MNLFERISQRLGLDTQSTARQPIPQEALNEAKIHKRAGRYEEALAELDRADALSGRYPNSAVSTAIGLHRADILILQSRWEEAETLLTSLKKEASSNEQFAQLAYILIGLGALAQAQGDPETARTFYEQALDPARESRSSGAEGRAQGYLGDIYLQDGNASYAVYLLEDAIPKLDAGGDTELVSYFVGRLGEAKIEVGRKDQGQHLIERALRLAEQAQFHRYIIMWRRALAVRAITDRFYGTAKRYLTMILDKSDKALIEPPEHTAALCWMSQTCLRLGDHRIGLDYARQAFDQAIQLGTESDSYLLAQGTLGIALRTNGEHAEALPYLTEATQHYQRLTLTEADYTYSDILRNLAATQSEVADYSGAQATYDQALEYAQAQDMPLEIANIHRDQGILQARQGDLSQAIAEWLKAVRLFENQHAYTRAARLRCDIANARRHLGQGKRAMRDYSEALMLLSSVEDRQTRGVILANAAVAYADQGDTDTAESFFVESILIAEQYKERQAEATRRGNHGWFLMTTGWPKQAQNTLEKAIQQSTDLDLTLQAAVQTSNSGLIYYDLGDYQRALEFQQRALEMLHDQDSSEWRAMIQANTGHVMVAMRRLDEAESLFSAALATGRKTRFAELIIRALNGQAKIALERGENDTAGEMIQEAITLARRAVNNRLLAEATLLLSQYHAQTGQREQAMADWEAAIKIQKTLRRLVDDQLPPWLRDHDSEPESTDAPES
jgi:tetratricopeptide (TPR) repeat protein